MCRLDTLEHQELSKVMLELLSKEPADNVGYYTILEVLQQAPNVICRHRGTMPVVD